MVVSNNSDGNNMETKNIAWALVAGLALAAIGVGLFFVLFTALEATEPAIRLFTSMCIPPVVMGIIVLGFLLLRRDRS